MLLCRDATADDWNDPMAGKSVYVVRLRHTEKQRHGKKGVKANVANVYFGDRLTGTMAR
jgi:hypothetical protein